MNELKPSAARLLVVDDDEQVRGVLARNLQGEFEVTAATDGNEALALLEDDTFDLVLTDLRMPETVDGLKFLSRLREAWPEMPVAVLTATSPESLEKESLAPDIRLLSKKKISLGHLKSTLHELASRPKGQGSSIFRSLSTSAILQLLEMERKTCTVRVRRGSRHGELVMVEGRLVGARTGDRTGEAAALEILGWLDGEIDVEPTAVRPAEPIQTRLAALLLEAAQKQDEARAARMAAAAPKLAVPAAALEKLEPERPAEKTSAPVTRANERSPSKMEENLDLSRLLAGLAGVEGWIRLSPDGREIENRLPRLEGAAIVIAYLFTRLTAEAQSALQFRRLRLIRLTLAGGNCLVVAGYATGPVAVLARDAAVADTVEQKLSQEVAA